MAQPQHPASPDHASRLGPEDVETATAVFLATTAPFLDVDWHERRAGDLDWDVRDTVCHVVDALGSYALLTASRSAQRIRADVACHAAATNEEVVHALHCTSAALQCVLVAAPPSLRAWHFWGMADREGFIALACNELLVHGFDVARGLGHELAAPADLCVRVTRRLFPWSPQGHAAWPTLLWASGRASLGGHERLAAGWVGHVAPLAEWDGQRPF